MPRLDRITLDPTVMGGRACIRGIRITVATILNQLAAGMSADKILAEYPRRGVASPTLRPRA